MSGNTFGRLFRLTTYGESHGSGIGGVIDGCPPGIELDEALLQAELDRRRPGQGGISATPRREPDAVSILSGVFEGRTTGTPIAFHIANTAHQSGDYDALRSVYRPGHADFTYEAKYGCRDHRGGGRSSARETAARVAGGAVARAFLKRHAITVRGACTAFGGIPATSLDMEGASLRPYYAADDVSVPVWDNAVREAKHLGDSLGGLVRIEVSGVMPGLGEPVFDRLDALFAHALMSVGAVKGVEVGSGFAAAAMKGSEHNDGMARSGFISNNAGGILGGISTGQSIVLTVAVKPIPSISKEQQTLTREGVETTISVGGRHDVSAIPRIVPVLEAMTALVLADALLMQRAAV